MAIIFGRATTLVWGTNYSAMDSPGGLSRAAKNLLWGDHPNNDIPLEEGNRNELQLTACKLTGSTGSDHFCNFTVTSNLNWTIRGI